MKMEDPERTNPNGQTAGKERTSPALLLSIGAAAGALLALIVALFRGGRKTRPTEVQSRAVPDGMQDRAAPAAVLPAVPPLQAGPGPTRVAPRPGVGPMPAPPTQSTRWSTPTKYIVGVGLFLACLFVVIFARGTIPLIIIAALLAFVIQPVIRFFQQRVHMGRGGAVLLTYLLVIVVLLLIPLVVLPGLLDAINSAINVDWQAVAQGVVEGLERAAVEVRDIPVLGFLLGPTLQALVALLQGTTPSLQPEQVPYEATISAVGSRLGQALGVLAKILGPVISAIVSLVFMLLISLHLSLSADKIRQGYPKLLPPAYESEVTQLMERITDIWGAFLRGQLTLMVLIGAMIALGNWALGNSFPLLLGLVSGTLELIPNLGPFLALIPGVTVALLFGSSHFAMSNLVFALIILVFYCLVQVLENQLVVPYVLGEAVDLPPLVVILGVMVFGSTIGILGVLLATPTIATGRELFMYLYNKILEPPPAESQLVEKPSVMDRFRQATQRVRVRLRRAPGSEPTGPDSEIQLTE